MDKLFFAYYKVIPKVKPHIVLLEVQVDMS
jgi:hypothetical protein